MKVRVEVVSPTARWSEVEEKVAEYLAIGVQDGEDVLPGFTAPVKELFE